MKKLADALIELQREIPPEINWVLRVDGHTDNRAGLRQPPLPRQLGAFVGPRDVRGEVPDRERRTGQSPGRRGLRRIPAAGPRPIRTMRAASNRRIELKLTER